MQEVTNSLRNMRALVDNNTILEKLQNENIIHYGVEYHRKLALSFACFLLFMIGAPLGAIIRKGGLGLPLVFAVIFFITYHMLNITGEKLAKSAKLPPWGGMWMATGILIPIAVWLIITARNDSQIFSKDLYLRIIAGVRRIFAAKKTEKVAAA